MHSGQTIILSGVHSRWCGAMSAMCLESSAGRNRAKQRCCHQKTKYGLVVYQEKIVGGKGEISTTPIHCIGAIKVVYSWKVNPFYCPAKPSQAQTRIEFSSCKASPVSSGSVSPSQPPRITSSLLHVLVQKRCSMSSSFFVKSVFYGQTNPPNFFCLQACEPFLSWQHIILATLPQHPDLTRWSCA